ncbi:MAG: hypothetical protein ACLQBA_10600 [Candidatus Binataceae bacterium]
MKCVDIKAKDPEIRKRDFSLVCNRGVDLKAFHMEETYGGWLEGAIVEEYNDRLISQARSRLDKTWGFSGAIYVIPPTSRIVRIHSINRRKVLLPPWCYHALLTSKAIDDHYCGSSLVVIWFGEREMERTVHEMVEGACRYVPWDQYAKDFDY